MKCRTDICHGKCCYNVPFEELELERFKDKIVNKVLEVEFLPTRSNFAKLPITCEIKVPEDMMNNKCPFLTKDYKCNIYEHRPYICRLYGQIKDLPCEHIE